jgi:hypothetical protein
MLRIYKSLISLAIVGMLINGCSSLIDITKEHTIIRGKAVDGYLNSATVCLDLSMDGYCQIGVEPATSTDVNGSYTLKVDLILQEHENFNIAPILVYDGKDNDTGKRFTGKLKAPNNGETINVTPLTTMIATSIEKEDKTLSKAEIQKKINVAETKLKEAFGLSSNININNDPIVERGNGNDDLIKISLSLQKSLQTLAKAGLSDDKNDKSEAELIEDMFEAMVFAIDEQSENTLNGLLDAMFNNIDSQGLMPEKTKKSLQAAKTIGESVIKHYDGFEGDLSKISSKIEQDIDSMEVDFKDFNPNNGDFNSSYYEKKIDYDEYDARVEGFIAEYKHFGITDSYHLEIDKIPDVVKPWNMYDDDMLKLLKGKAPELYKKIKSMNEKWENEEKKRQAKHSNSKVDISLPFSYYDVYQNITSKYYTHNVTFGADDTFISKYYKFDLDNSSFDEDNSNNNYYLTKNGFQKDGGEIYFTMNKEDLIHISSWNQDISIVSNENIKGDYYVEQIGLMLNMPSRAEKTLIKVKYLDNIVWVRNKYINKEKKPYTNFKDFIETQCGENFFSNGVAFGGSSKDNYYTCDGTQKNGNLVYADYVNGTSKLTYKDAGKWKIITQHGKKILALYPLKKYCDTDDIKIYTIFDENSDDDVLWEGIMKEKGSMKTFYNYNASAIKAIENYIIKHKDELMPSQSE